MEFGLIWLVLFLPLAGSILQALLGKRIIDRRGPAKGKKLLGWMAVLPIAMAFGLAVVVTLGVLDVPAEVRDEISALSLFNWVDLKSLLIPFEVRIDPLSMTMTLIITGIGTLIHLYATGYMAEEKDYPRFFTYLNLFISSMLILVLGNNLVMMFIGWEGVGVCSYLLIGFWYKDIANAKAANKAFIVNRIGDWGLTLGMFLLVAFMLGNLQHLIDMGRITPEDPRWLSYDVLLPLAGDLLKLHPGVATAIALLFFVGAMGKSAQFPLYLWLPDAMAGPTPVSALIHAATMVTAGVFLLNRMHPFFELAPVAMGIVAVVGAFTAIFAALVAFGQTDIKKVLAYSTVSQLGFMFVACGVGAFWVGIFHVITHAFFKALLFLGSGAVIHAMAHDQDMRHYGKLFKYIPITGTTMFIGWAAIVGFPWVFAGFWSKEAIIAAALGNHVAEIGGVSVSAATGWVLLVAATLTAAYMTRMMWLTFKGDAERWRLLPEAGHHDDHAHDHADHAHHGEHHAHDHGPDEHGFFYTDEELAAQHAAEHHDHHHALDPNHNPHEVPKSMWIPLVALAIPSIASGFLLYKPFGDYVLKHWLYPNGLTYLSKEAVSGHPHGWVGSALLAMSIAAFALGSLYGWMVYRKGLPKRERDEAGWHPFRRSAGNQFGYDAAMMDAGIEGGGLLANWTWKRFDAGLVDGLVNGAAWVSGLLGRGLRVIQTGFARTYALMMLLGGVAILAYFVSVILQQGGGR